MATNLKTIVFVSLCILIILAVLEFGLSDGRRSGGFRSGSRSYRSYRSYRSSSTRVRVRSGTRVRIRSGSSPFSRTTFKAALIGGSIYGSLYYMRSSRYRRYPSRMPTVCTNNYDGDSNGTVYGYFICPRYGEPTNYDHCCGDSQRERCCKYFDENDQGRTAGIVIGVILAIIIIAIVVYCICKKSGKGGQIVQKFSSNKNGGPVNMVPVPAQPCVPPPGAYPPQPAAGYNPATPYQPTPYPPAYGEAPPPVYDNTTKPLMPDGTFSDGGMPYPVNPAQPPYPPQGSNPYPPAGNMDYPPAGNMDYPPQGNVGYPQPYPPPQGFASTGPSYPATPPPPYPQ